MPENKLADQFDNLQGKITELFKPVFDPFEQTFIDTIAKFQKAGVDFLEINNFKKTAIAKHSNYYEYPDRRYAVVVADTKPKFYELEFKSADIDDGAKELTQQEFEALAIPLYLKPNPLLNKEDNEEDKDPKQEDVEGTKEKKDKEALSQIDEEPKKTIESGDTLSPKIKESFERMNELTSSSDSEGALYDALSVIIKDKNIRSWLEQNDPKALEQAELAIGLSGHALGKAKPSVNEVTPPGFEKAHRSKDRWSMKNKGIKPKEEACIKEDTSEVCHDEQEAADILKEKGIDFDDSYEDNGLTYFFIQDKIVGKFDPQSKIITIYEAGIEEATEKPILNPTDTQGYTGTVGNLGPLEGKRDRKTKSYIIPSEVMDDYNDGNETAVADYLSDKIGTAVKNLKVMSGSAGTGVAYDVEWDVEEESENEGYPAIQPEGIQYKVKFVNKDGKNDSIVVESKSVKDASSKVYGFGAKSIISAKKIKIEKRKETK